MTTITVPMKPRGKGRPRFAGKRCYTPATTREAEERIRVAWLSAHGACHHGAVALEVEAVFAIPASWPKRKRLNAGWHLSRPDADNIAKLVGDALNGYAFVDDAQVACLATTKTYGEADELRITVRPL